MQQAVSCSPTTSLPLCRSRPHLRRTPLVIGSRLGVQQRRVENHTGMVVRARTSAGQLVLSGDVEGGGGSSERLLPMLDGRVSEDGADKTYTVEDAIDHVGTGPFQFGMLFYVGLIWFADAMELMMLSYIGPAVSNMARCFAWVHTAHLCCWGGERGQGSEIEDDDDWG